MSALISTPILIRTLGLGQWQSLILGQSIGALLAIAVDAGWTALAARIQMLTQGNARSLYLASMRMRTAVYLASAGLAGCIALLGAAEPVVVLSALAWALTGLGPFWLAIAEGKAALAARFGMIPRVLANLLGSVFCALTHSAIAFPLTHFALVGASVVLATRATRLPEDGPLHRIPIEGFGAAATSRVLAETDAWAPVTLLTLTCGTTAQTFIAVDRIVRVIKTLTASVAQGRTHLLRSPDSATQRRATSGTLILSTLAAAVLSGVAMLAWRFYAPLLFHESLVINARQGVLVLVQCVAWTLQFVVSTFMMRRDGHLRLDLGNSALFAACILLGCAVLPRWQSATDAGLTTLAAASVLALLLQLFQWRSIETASTGREVPRLRKLKAVLRFIQSLVFFAFSKLAGRMEIPYSIRWSIGWLLPPYFGRSKYRSIYIVTYGRSGSTLLMAYLNTLPGVSIRGENSLFPVHLLAAQKELHEASSRPSRARELQTDPWFGSQLFSAERFVRDVRRAVLNQLYPNVPIPKTIGFKEIRWADLDSEIDVWRQIELLAQLRPPAAFIFLRRDLSVVLRSGWWASASDLDREQARARLSAFEQATDLILGEPTFNCITINYEDFCMDATEAQRLCEFLGLSFSRRRWQRILERPHSVHVSASELQLASSLPPGQAVMKLLRRLRSEAGL